MNAHDVAQTQKMVEKLVQPALVEQQKMVQEMAERVLQPALVEQQKAIQQAVRPALVQSLVEQQKVVERALQPAVVQQLRTVQEIAERTLQPGLVEQQRAVQRAVGPAVRHQNLVEGMFPAIETGQWSDELFDSSELVSDFGEATGSQGAARSVEPAGTRSVDWGLTHSVGFYVTAASYMVDMAIEQRGLSEAVTEVKRRRWVLRLVLTLLAIAYYSGKL